MKEETFVWDVLHHNLHVCTVDENYLDPLTLDMGHCLSLKLSSIFSLVLLHHFLKLQLEIVKTFQSSERSCILI